MISRKDQLREIAPHIWSMYQQLMSSRGALENRLNFFLAIDSLLLIGFLQLFGGHVSSLRLEYMIPCILLIVPILSLLVNFLGSQMRGAWMDFEEHEYDEPLLNTIKNNEFYERWISDLYSHAEGSWKYRKRIYRLLRACVACALGALTWLLLLLLCCSESNVTLYLFLSSSTLTVGILAYTIPNLLRDFAYRDREHQIRRKIVEWLSEDNTKVQ